MILTDLIGWTSRLAGALAEEMAEEEKERERLRKEVESEQEKDEGDSDCFDGYNAQTVPLWKSRTAWARAKSTHFTVHFYKGFDLS